MDHEETVTDLMESDEGIGDEEEDVEEEGRHDKLLETITALDGRKRTAVQRSEPSAVISEFNLSQVGKEKVKLHELVASLKESSSHISLKKQLRSVTRRTRVLNVPLAKPQAERIKREVAYGKVTKELDKWDPIVESNRVADHLEFPLKQPFLGNISTESFVKKFEHHTPLELEVAKILSGSDNTLTDDRTLTPAEERALKAMSLEEAKERLAELRKARVLLSYKESRARRQNRIKSKGYHRILKRERIRKELKEFEELQKTDPEKAIDRLKDIEKMRIEERMTLKHKNTGKWAKQRMIRAKYDDQSRAALTEQLELSRQLTKKIQAPTDSEEEEADQTQTRTAMEDGDENESEFIHLQAPLASYNPWMRSSNSKGNDDVVPNIATPTPRVDVGDDLHRSTDILPVDTCPSGDSVPEMLQNNESSREPSALVTPTSDSESFTKEPVVSAQSEEMDTRMLSDGIPDDNVGKEDPLIEFSSKADDIVNLSSNSESDSADVQSQDEDASAKDDRAVPEISMVKDGTHQNNCLVTLRSDSENSECEVVGNVLTLSDSENSECEILDGTQHQEADNAVGNSQGKSTQESEEYTSLKPKEKNSEFSKCHNRPPLSTRKVCSPLNSEAPNHERELSATESFDSFSGIPQDKEVTLRNQKDIPISTMCDIDPADSFLSVVSVPEETLLVKQSKILQEDSTGLDDTDALELKRKVIDTLDNLSLVSTSSSTPCLENVARILDELGDEETNTSSRELKMSTKGHKRLSRRSKPLPSFSVTPLKVSERVLTLQELIGSSDDEMSETEKSMFSKPWKKNSYSIRKSTTLPTFLISPLKVAGESEKKLQMQQLSMSFDVHMGEKSSSEPKEDRLTRHHKKNFSSKKSKTLPSFSVSPLNVVIEPAKRLSTQKLNKSCGKELVESSSEEDDTFWKMQNEPLSSRKLKTKHSFATSTLAIAKELPTLTTSFDEDVPERSREPEKESTGITNCQTETSSSAKLKTLQSRLIASLNSSCDEEARLRTERSKANTVDDSDELSSEPEEEPFLDEMVLGENEVGNKSGRVKRLKAKEDNSEKQVSKDQRKPEVQIDPTKFVMVNTKRLKTKLPDLVEAGDEGLDDDEDENSYKMTIAEAFADDDVLDEFKAEKRRIVDEDNPKDVDLFLPGWGSWGGQGIKPSRRKRRRFTLKAPDAPPRKDGTLGNVIINERKDLKAAEHQVSELPFPFKTVRDYESSIRQPVGNTWNPETAFRQLIVPKVTTRMGAIIDPIDGDALKSKPKRRKQNKKKTTKNPALSGNAVEI